MFYQSPFKIFQPTKKDESKVPLGYNTPLMNRDEFESLNPEEQIRLFSTAPLTEKSEMILLAHEPGRLTQGMSGEELYLMTRDLDLDEKAEILRYAAVSQLSFLADMDCWTRDQIDAGHFVKWLGSLLAADDKVLLSWIHQSDYETIIAGFQKFATVLKPEWETVVDDLVGDRPYFTLDRMYYILAEDENLEIVKRVIELLYENDRPRYFALLEGVLGEMEYEMEEEAYRRRERRLADRGFPDLETALKAMIPLNREDFFKFPLKESLRESEDSADEMTRLPAPRYPVLWKHSRRFLDDVLVLLQDEADEIREGVYEELAWLSNKIVVCHGMDFTSEEKVENAVNRVQSLVSLGLEILSEGNLEEAVKLLRERWVETFFRFSLSKLYPLREQLKEIILFDWKGESEIFFTFLEPPYELIARGLFQKVPLCYDETVTDSLYHHREFVTRQDLDRATLAISQIECLHALLKRLSPSVFAGVLRGAGLGGAEESLSAFCGTLFARYVLYAKAKPEGLEKKELEDFLEKAFDEREGKRYLKTDLKSSFMEKTLTAEERNLLMPFWGIVFQRIQEQMSGLKSAHNIEPWLLTCVRKRPEPEEAAGKTKPRTSSKPSRTIKNRKR